ncbi:hypothetical protein [Corallococcus macrosporus]|uniref:Uncharacterized protein n=1 Tax=Corallococcus macrosporus DSM 14697 TaxID=1189310 RepID=A0A250JMI0_9BACT|nr:hypothetical protein [Corallococcus macrosporus]ATB44591.1 hypothetical protein MYMAC_000162 [Corallococcus macrosporus DSM 14697]
MWIERCVEACQSKWVPLLGGLGLGLVLSAPLILGYGCEVFVIDGTPVQPNGLFFPNSPFERIIYHQLKGNVNAFTPLVTGLSLVMLIAGLWAHVVKSSRTVALLAFIPALNTLLLLAQQGASHLEYVRVTWIPPPELAGIVEWALLQHRAIKGLLALSSVATVALLALGVIANGVRILRGFTMRPRLQT